MRTSSPASESVASASTASHGRRATPAAAAPAAPSTQRSRRSALTPVTRAQASASTARTPSISWLQRPGGACAAAKSAAGVGSASTQPSPGDVGLDPGVGVRLAHHEEVAAVVIVGAHAEALDEARRHALRFAEAARPPSRSTRSSPASSRTGTPPPGRPSRGRTPATACIGTASAGAPPCARDAPSRWLRRVRAKPPAR